MESAAQLVGELWPLGAVDDQAGEVGTGARPTAGGPLPGCRPGARAVAADQAVRGLLAAEVSARSTPCSQWPARIIREQPVTRTAGASIGGSSRASVQGGVTMAGPVGAQPLRLGIGGVRRVLPTRSMSLGGRPHAVRQTSQVAVTVPSRRPGEAGPSQGSIRPACP